MASPLPSKRSVDLAKPGKLGSRIRRDPPPAPKKVLSRAELREREQRRMIIGIVAIALAMFVILIGVNQWNAREGAGEGWHIDFNDRT